MLSLAGTIVGAVVPSPSIPSYITTLIICEQIVNVCLTVSVNTIPPRQICNGIGGVSERWPGK